MVARVVDTGLPLIYLNMVGGQDDQVFDGASFGLNPGGELAFQMPQFDEAIAHVDCTAPRGWRICRGGACPCLGMGTGLPGDGDRAARLHGKTGFSKVLLGLSGGIDSAIVAAIAADALGPENVRCVMLPSEYTSRESLEDAEAVARAAGVPYDYVPISEGRAAITNTLAPLFEGRDADLTEENIQSRLRGLLLMAMSTSSARCC